MEESKKLQQINLSFEGQDKIKIEKKKIIFMDISLSTNHLLLLSSTDILYLCELLQSVIKIKKEIKHILPNPNAKIIKCYFCNGKNDSLLLLSNDFNIYEYSVIRDYVSHIYYLVLDKNYIFKMNWQKNLNAENRIKNFCIHKKGELKVWNTLNYNKSNILSIQDAICFSYDCTGIALFILGKSSSKNSYYLSVVKFINEYSCQELYFKFLDFLESKIDINYIDIFDNLIMMCDKSFKTIYILKAYPINKFDFIITLNNRNVAPLLLFPFLGENHLYQYGLLYIDLKEEKQKILNICYKSNRFSTVNVDLIFHEVRYYKESNNGKSLLFTFDDGRKQLKQFLL